MRLPARLPVAAGVVASACGLVAALGPACSKTVAAGGLEVLVATNLATPQDFDTLAIEVDQQVGSGNTWKTYLKDSVLIPGEAQLPAAISIQAGSSSDQLARIRLTALKDGHPIDLRVATVQVPTDRVAQMTLIIAESCVGQLKVADGVASPACPTDESCQPPTGTCGPDLVRGPLPIYTPHALDSIDASAGSFKPPADGGGDARPRPTKDAGHDTGSADAGGCDAADCPVQVDDHGATSLASDPVSLYFCRSCSGCTIGVFKAPLAGGPVVNLSVGGGCGAVAVDPDTDNVLWTDPVGGSVEELDESVPNITTYAQGQKSLGAMAVYHGEVYWTRPTESQSVASDSLAMPTVPTLSSRGLAGAAGLAVDATGVYVTLAPTGATPGSAWKLSLQDQIVSPLAQAQQSPEGIALASGSLYWAASGAAGAIWRDDLKGDAGASPLVMGQPFAYGVATDATHVYWTQSTQDGAVVAAHLDGSHVVTLAAHQDSPGAILVASGIVFWATKSGVWKVKAPTD